MLRWLGLFPLLLACSHDKPAVAPAPAPPRVAAPAPAPTPAPPPPRLFDDAETKVTATEILARIATNATRRCPAPRMIGATTPGPSAPDMIALVEGSGEVADCVAKLVTVATSALKAELEAKKPELVALETECGPVFERAIHRGAAHEEGCSPYQVGVRADPPRAMTVIHLAHLTAFRARVLADKDPARAAGLLVDALRVAQDLERGHPTLIAVMIAAAASEILGSRLDAILDTARLSKLQLETLDAALATLVNAFPSFSDILEGEREAQELYLGLAGFMGDDWTPPGGRSDMMPPQDGKHIADPRDEAAAMLAALELTAAARDTACPAGSTLKECKAGLERMPTPAPPGHLDVAELWRQGMTDQPAMRAKVRKQIIAILASVAQPAFGKYVEKVGPR